MTGGQITRNLSDGLALYGRGEMAATGGFHYDEANTASQDAYTLAHFRAGLRGRFLFGEVWVRNAFDARFVPVALPLPGLAPSGFVGEPGRPRTYGVSVGATF
jgi:hypothetical protein